MSVKLYDGADTLFLTAWELARKDNPALPGQPSKRQWKKFKEGRGASARKLDAAKRHLEELKAAKG
jgi:hypothetical protein